MVNVSAKPRYRNTAFGVCSRRVMKCRVVMRSYSQVTLGAGWSWAHVMNKSLGIIEVLGLGLSHRE